jgi:hypothetical protein
MIIPQPTGGVVAVPVIGFVRIAAFANITGCRTAGKEGTAGGKVYHIGRLSGDGKKPIRILFVQPGHGLNKPPCIGVPGIFKNIRG